MEQPQARGNGCEQGNVAQAQTSFFIGSYVCSQAQRAKPTTSQLGLASGSRMSSREERLAVEWGDLRARRDPRPAQVRHHIRGASRRRPPALPQREMRDRREFVSGDLAHVEDADGKVAGHRRRWPSRSG